MTSRTEVRTSSGEIISVSVDGLSEAPAVLLITGFIGIAEFWKPVVDMLKSTYRVISYDQRGTGLSGKYDTPLTMQQLANDAATVIQKHAPDGAIILGHSMGACAAWILADKTPQFLKGAYVLAGWDRADAWMERVFEARLTAFKDTGPLAYTRATTLFMNPPTIVNSNAAAFSDAEQVLSLNLPCYQELEERTDAVLSFDAHIFNPQKDLPMRIACAADDWMTPIELSENLKAMNDHASFKKFDIGGHYLPKTKFNDLVKDFEDWVTGLHLS